MSDETPKPDSPDDQEPRKSSSIYDDSETKELGEKKWASDEIIMLTVNGE
jgi:hypothetical protein